MKENMKEKEKRICLGCGKEFSFEINNVPANCPDCQAHLSLTKKSDLPGLLVYSKNPLFLHFQKTLEEKKHTPAA